MLISTVECVRTERLSQTDAQPSHAETTEVAQGSGVLKSARPTHPDAASSFHLEAA